MTSPFAALDSQLSGAVDGVFGELFLFEAFMVGGDVDLPKVADVARQSFTAIAIWSDQTKSVTPHARGSVQDDNAHNWTASHPSITIADDNLLWRPQPGDRVTRLDGGAVHQVGKPPRPDGIGRTTIPLSDRKR